jgi:homoserine kinase
VPPFDPFAASVPASSANLGPGFDAVGIALELRLRASVEPADRFELEFAPGGEAPSHDGLAVAIELAMRRVEPDLPCARVRITNHIPLGKGLGSSAAAGVLGLAIAMRVHRGRVAMRELAAIACELEGHPDNALPAILGGAIVCAGNGARDYLRVPASRELRALVVVPDLDFPTDRDVVFTAQRSAMLGAALASSSWRELGLAMHDRVHQPYRAPGIPGMEEALALRVRGVIGSALSGAGPSLIALLHPRSVWERIAPLFEACFTRAGVASHSLALAPAARGLIFGKLDSCTRPC